MLSVRQHEAADVASLTAREREVLECVAAGMANKEIAAFLCIADGTVRKHLENVYGKLGVGSRTAALARLQDRRRPVPAGIPAGTAAEREDVG